MKTILLSFLSGVLILLPFLTKSQSNITVDNGAVMEIQTGADICADTRTINGILIGNGTWCLVPLTPAAPVLNSPAINAFGQLLSVNLVWLKSYGALTYRIQLSADSLFSALIVNDSTVIDTVRAVSGLVPLTYYWWRVNAKGIGGTSIFSAVYKFRTLGYPNTVTLINPPNNSINQPVSIQFRWSRASEQTSPFAGIYRFSTERREPGVFFNAELTGETDAVSNYWFEMVTDTLSMANLLRDTLLTDTTKSVSGLVNNTNYYWRVRAKNQIGWGSYSFWFKFTTILATPAPPVLSSPANNATGQNLSLMLVWFKASTASTYRIQVAADSLFTSLILNDSTLTDSTRAISGLTPLTNYWWRVNAKNIGGTSAYSAVWKFRTLGYPNTVTLINPPNNAVNQPVSIQFRWSRASEQTSPFADKYKNSLVGEIDAVSNYWFDMVTDTLSMTNLTRDTTLTDTTKSVSGLTNNTNYFWRVKAKNQVGWGSFSGWWKFTTIVSVPAAPVLYSPANNANNQPVSLNLVWLKSLYAASYRVQLASDSLFTNLIVNDSTLTDSVRAVSGLSYSTNYWWRVNAKNTAGTSAYSSVFKFITAPLPPAVVNLKVIPGGFYNAGTGRLNMRDTIRIMLVDSTGCLRSDSTTAVLDSVTFTASISFSNIATGSYYMYIFHRNHILISSRLEQSIIRGSTVNYDFTNDSTKAYGSIMIRVSSSPLLYGMIPGDANRDGFVDGLDQTIWVVQNGLDGYLSADFNGDSFVDGLDQTLWVLYNGQSYFVPCELIFEDPASHVNRVKSMYKNQLERITKQRQKN